MIWRNIIEAITVARTRFPPVLVAGFDVTAGAAVVARDHPGVMDRLARLTYEIAEDQIGCGEAGGNNMGPDVARYIAPARCPANWCGGGTGWCFQEAAGRLAIPLPFKRSLGAKALGRNIGAVGRIFSDPTEVLPGDVAVWHRGPNGSWQGHIEPCGRFDGRLHTVAFNSGPKVRRVARAWPSPRFAFFASLRR